MNFIYNIVNTRKSPLEITRFLQIKENLNAIIDPENKEITENKNIMNLFLLERHKFEISLKFSNEIENSCNLLDKNFN